ncbi:MAG: hypothetical protein VX346_03035 [Planctomycetota bacterium]|nr:hypothetical protein [Planctomycetota bacterium]
MERGSRFAVALWSCFAWASITATPAQGQPADPLPGMRYELYDWKWSGKDVRAYRGEGEEPEYLLPGQPLPALTAAEQQLGFVVFTTPWMERTFPISVPSREQITDRLQLAAAAGEFEPLTFLVRPQRDLKSMTLVVESPLTGPDGALIPTANVRLGIVNGWARYGNFITPIRTGIAPLLQPVDIDRDYTEQFWLTVQVPAEASAGVYQGAIQLLLEGVVVKRLELNVEVRPIQLLEPDAAFGMYFDHGRIPRQWASADYLEKYYRDMADHGMTSVTIYNAHGAAADGSKFVLTGEAAAKLGIDIEKNKEQKYYGIDQEVVYDFQHNRNFLPGDPRYDAGLDVMLERARRAGLLRQNLPLLYLGGAIDYSWIETRHKELNIPWPGITPEVKDCVTIAQRGQERGWPELLFYLMDEVGGIDPYNGDRRMLWMREVIRPIKAAGLRTADANGYLYKTSDYQKWYGQGRKLDKHELIVNEQGLIVDELLVENILHHLGITLLSTSMGVDEKTLSRLRAMKKDYWLYNCAQPALHPEVDRFHYGLYTWRTGAKGFFMWHYTSTEWREKGQVFWPWMDGQATFHNTGHLWPMYAVLSPRGPIPTISWEAIREGVDDYRYLLTLRHHLHRAEQGTSEEQALAAEARNVLTAMRERIPIDAPRRTYTEVGAAAIHAWHDLDTVDYDDFRRTVADWIVRLAAARSK